MKLLRKRVDNLEQSREHSGKIKETAIAIFNKDGSITIEWQSQQFKLKDESEYEEFLDDNDLRGSPTNITVIEVRSQGEMPQVS